MKRCSPSLAIRTVLLFIYCLTSCACSSFDLIPSDSLIQRLKGRGPVLVSPDNPYLAANLLLQQESQNSKELAGFIQIKGQPSALSVTQEFFTPAIIKLYYHSSSNLEGEQYDIELLQGIWVIKGPGSIEDQTARNLLKSSSALTSFPPTKPELTQKLAQREKPNREQELVPLFDLNSEPEVVSENTRPAEHEMHKIEDEHKEESSENIVSQDPVQESEGMRIDDLISRYHSSPAETTPRGDVVHFVTSSQETLELIASWYTKTDLTLSRIARANRLTASDILRPGDQIVIPAELVKNKMRLPEEAIQDLTAKP